MKHQFRKETPITNEQQQQPEPEEETPPSGPPFADNPNAPAGGEEPKDDAGQGEGEGQGEPPPTT